MNSYRLYGSPISYYTGKVRAYLEYKRIPHEEVLSTASVFRDVIIPRTGVRFIPVLISPDDIAVQDSTEIIDFLEPRFPESPVYPSTPRQHLAALLFEIHGDEWLKMAAMHYRWAYNRDFIVEAFVNNIGDDLPAGKARELAEQRIDYFSGSLPHLGVTPSTVQAVEADYEQFLEKLNKHFSEYNFLFGENPSIGDFGLFGPLYAHLYRDPASGKLMQRIAPNVAGWVERMLAPAPGSGGFLPHDDVPDSLTPILKDLFAEHFPLLVDTSKLLGAWIDEHPGESIPRSVGEHEFSIHGTTGTRAVFPYAQWMLQRPLDFYRSQTGNNRAQLDDWLSGMGALELMQFSPPHRVARVNNILTTT